MQIYLLFAERKSDALQLKILIYRPKGTVCINAAGVTVVSCESESGRMNLSQLPAGLYIARVVTEEGKTIQIKFIK